MSDELRRELAALGRLTGPLLVAGVGYMLLGAVDTAIVGRVGEVPLGAVGLGASLFFAVSVLGWGWMLALDPLIGQAMGAREAEAARETFWQGIWVAVAGTVPLSAILVGLTLVMPALGVEPSTDASLRPYLFARAPGIGPFLIMAGCRAFLQGHEITRPLIVSVVVANVINVPLSWGLVFGVPSLGVPQMGAEGAGWASTVASVVQAVLLAVAVREVWGDHRGMRPPRAAAMQKIWRLGTPIGLQLVAEIGSFAIVGVLVANLGTRALGAHQVALQWISMTFQLPLALGAATATRVGHAIGRGDAPGTRRSGLTGIYSVALLMLGFSVALLVAPAPLARLYTDVEPVVAAAIPLLAVAAAFQLFDGVQAVAAGALRGAGDTRWPLIANVVGHYAIGVPLGAGLAFGAGWGAVGLWWGLSAGLTAVAIALTVRFHGLSRGSIGRA